MWVDGDGRDGPMVVILELWMGMIEAVVCGSVYGQMRKQLS